MRTPVVQRSDAAALASVEKQMLSEYGSAQQFPVDQLVVQPCDVPAVSEKHGQLPAAASPKVVPPSETPSRLAALEQFDLRSVAAPYLTRPRDQTRQTALLSVPANGEPIVLSCVEYRDRLSITSRPGNRPPPHCSSQGRIALAFAEGVARKRVLGRKLTAFTSRSITSRDAIEERLRLIRERFFEDANDEVRIGINALAAPVFRDDDELAGIIGIIGTSAEIGAPPARPLIVTLHRLAAALSAELNCRIYYERNLVK
jgi:DNA-binding IclR family transcriptional regulator